MTSVLQASLTGGELSPSLYGRVDLARYANSLAMARNVIIQPYGGIKNRPGTRYVADVKNSSARVRLLPFQFNTDQTYVLEFGNLYMRVFKNGQQVVYASASAWATSTAYAVGARVQSGTSVYRCLVAHTSGAFATDLAAGKWVLLGVVGAVVEVATPYTTAQLSRLKYTQSADVMTLVHPSHAPRTLSRRNHDDWTVEVFALRNGPFMEVNTDTGVSVSTSSETLAGTLTATAPIFTADTVGRLFYMEQRDYGVPWEPGKVVAVGDIRRSDGKYYQARAGGTCGTLRPIQSNSDLWHDGGVEWFYLHSGYGVARVDAVASDHKSASATILSRIPGGGTRSGFGTPKTATAHGYVTGGVNLTCVGHGVTSAGTCLLSVITPATTWAITTYLEVVDANNVIIHLDFQNGVLFSALIQSATSVTFAMETTGSGDYGRTYKWAFGAFGDPSIGGPGYPSSVCYHQQRLVFAGTTSQPETLWFSRTGAYPDFSVSSPVQADDAITGTLAASQVQEIRAMVPLDKLVVLTSGGEWIIGSGQEDALSPMNFGAKSQGSRGSGHLPPIGVGNTVLHVQDKGQVIRDMGYEFASDSYTGNDLTVMASHLVENRSIEEWAWQQHPFQCVWMIGNDGDALSMTYMREQQVCGWARHDTDGNFESVCTVSENNEDAVYFAVARTINGATRRTIERMASRKVLDIRDAHFVDCGLVFDGRNTGSTTITLSGGTNWDQNETLTVTASGAIFAYPETSDVGDQLHYIAADGTTYRLTVLSTSSTTVATVRPNRVIPAAYRSARTDWAWARNTMTGLSHLEGKTVSILGDGLVQLQKVVTGGAISIQPAVRVHVGLPYLSDLQTLDPSLGLAETTLDKKKQITQVRVLVQESRGITAGRDFNNLYSVRPRSTENYDAPPSLVSGVSEVAIACSWDRRGQVCLRQADPLPITWLALMPDLQLGGS